MKYHIVQALQKKFQVGYLGEGINDLPVIKLANVGMVVDSAIDASKEVADVILMEKDLMVIVDGIFLGRKVFYNILKYLKHTMSANFGNFFSIGILSIFLTFTPLTPLQILLTNFITDLPLFGIAFDNVDDREIQKPAHYKLRELFILLIGLGAVGTLFSLFIFLIYRHTSAEMVRTVIYFQSSVSGIIVFYSIRTRGWFFKSAPSMIMNVLVSFSIVLTFISLMYPFNHLAGLVGLGWQSIALIIGLNIVYLFANDFMKITLIKNYFEKE
jgi:Mg2+-importing ATPase